MFWKKEKAKVAQPVTQAEMSYLHGVIDSRNREITSLLDKLEKYQTAVRVETSHGRCFKTNAIAHAEADKLIASAKTEQFINIDGNEINTEFISVISKEKVYY